MSRVSPKMPNPIAQPKAQHKKAQPEKAQQPEAQHIAGTTSSPKAWPKTEHKAKIQRKDQPKTLTEEENRLLSTKPCKLSDQDRRKRNSIKKRLAREKQKHARGVNLTPEQNKAKRQKRNEQLKNTGRPMLAY